MADFLFANFNQTVLIESKGSFTQKENDPTAIKSVLKRALKAQVDPWMSYLQPPPQNGYVVYSCLRESSWIPSAISVVDPVGGDGETALVAFDGEQVIRENYGAWLRAMGLPQAADRLTRLGSEMLEENFEVKPVEIYFLVCEYDDREFAFVAEPYLKLSWLDRCFPHIGIDFSVLKAISAVIKTPIQNFSEYLTGLPAQVDEQPEFASIFPDGSFLGLISLKNYRFESIQL